MRTLVFGLVVGAIAVAAPSAPQSQQVPAGFSDMRAADLKWMPNPAAPGSQTAVVFGDPTKAAPFAVRVRFAAGSSYELPFRDGAFDLVVSADVLYHRAVTDDGGALAELRRVCRPGGVVLLNLPAHRWLTADHDRAIHAARRYARRDLRRLATGAGLDVVRLSYFNCLLFPLAAAVRLATRRGRARSDVRPLPRGIDAALARVLEAEGWLLLRMPLPWGLSLFAVLRRPLAAADSVAGARAFG